MASLMEELADDLARDALRAAQGLGDDNLVNEISRAIGASSTTTQEAFLTAVRIRQAEQRARQLLAERLGPRYAEVIAPPRPAPGPAPERAMAEAPALAWAAGVRPERPMAEALVETEPEASRDNAFVERMEAAEPIAQVPGLAEGPVEALKGAPKAAEIPAEAQPAEPPPQSPAKARDTAPAGPAPVRPRMAASLDKPAAALESQPLTPTPDSLAAALALATALPRRQVTPAEPRRPVPPPDPDIEIPDGDWG